MPGADHQIEDLQGAPIIREAMVRSDLNDAIGFAGLLIFMPAVWYGLLGDHFSFGFALIFLILSTGAFNTAANNRLRIKGYRVEITLRAEQAPETSGQTVCVFSDHSLAKARLAAGAIITAMAQRTSS